MDLIQGGFDRYMLMATVLSIPTIIIALCFHESAHGWVAYKMGDSTARNFGRITMNPAKHFDPMGFLCMLCFGFGWAKPVPINSRNFRNPKWGMVITALAGPVSNLLLALGGMLIFQTASMFLTNSVFSMVIWYFLYYFCYLNIYLAVFNLLPVPPFDGSRIFLAFLPSKAYFAVMKYERVILIVILVLLWTGVISLPFGWLTNKIFEGFAWLTSQPVNLVADLINR
ncbi:MAG: site-2 protease family protein [Clostridia bacterium]|nr:site-2 protease family protein [Clostridia bacterium]